MHETSGVSLELGGVLSVRNVETLSAQIRAALRDHSSVILNCDAVAEVDLSFIQLLISARRSAVAGGKTLTVAVGDPTVLREAFQRAGIAIADGDRPDAFDLPLSAKTDLP